MITQADVDAGAVANTATVTGKNPTGATITSNASAVSTPTAATASLLFDKTAGTPNDTNGNGQIDVGDQVPFTFVVTNTGVVTLTQLAVADTKSTATCPVSTLAPGASTTCTGTHVITQAEADAGSGDNTAFATARRPGGTTVTSNSDSTSSTTVPVNRLTLTKSAGTPTDVNSNGRVDAGDRIPYRFLVTNTGAQTITNVAITDPRPARRPAPSTTLAPERVDHLHLDHRVRDHAGRGERRCRQQHRDRAGRDPAGTTVSSPASATSTPTSTVATLALTKSAGTPTDVNANGRVDAGDTVAYGFAVTNTGALTITGLAVTDAKVGATTCPTTTLAPGATTTCTTTAPYTITQADVNAGSVNNTATVSGRNPTNQPVTSNASSTATTTEHASPPCG